jgi:hypothetical protein
MVDAADVHDELVRFITQIGHAGGGRARTRIRSRPILPALALGLLGSTRAFRNAVGAIEMLLHPAATLWLLAIAFDLGGAAGVAAVAQRDIGERGRLAGRQRLLPGQLGWCRGHGCGLARWHGRRLWGSERGRGRVGPR